ncbi:hypothetical protein [Prauserella alba]|uniref:hypothetical protein n=1 Tax=Prauserella alba TaxID=176898 RepID=UPI0020A5486A|nr:hypothetical protein [Prauserella alba]
MVVTVVRPLFDAGGGVIAVGCGAIRLRRYAAAAPLVASTRNRSRSTTTLSIRTFPASGSATSTVLWRWLSTQTKLVVTQHVEAVPSDATISHHDVGLERNDDR